MSFGFQLKVLGEQLKDRLFKGRAVPFVFNHQIAFHIDSRSINYFEPFSIRSTHAESAQEINNFISLTKDKKCLLDIGALHGLFSLVFTANAPDKSAYAFDPSPRAFGFLEFNAKANPQSRISAYPWVVSDNHGPVIMKFESINQLSAVGANERVKKNKQNKIMETTTIDEFVAQNNIKPDVIKIDTEGFEYQVLKGGRQFIKANRPLIFLEVHPQKLPKHGLSVSKLDVLLKSLGYSKIYDLYGAVIEDIERYFDPKQAAYRTVVR